MSSEATTYTFHNPDSLENVIGLLPEAAERPIFWEDPDDDDSEFEYGKSKIETHKAVYNPATGELYGVVTGDYEIINPETFLLPMVEEVRDRDRDDVEGRFNVYDGGAYGYGELLFDTDAIWPPDRERSDNPVRVGSTVRYSHDGGISVRASGFAQDGMCTNTMRRVTDAVYVKHAGDVEARVDWREEWAAVFDQLGTFSEALATVIDSAIDFEMFDFTEDLFDQEWVDAANPQNAIEDISGPTGVDDEQVRGVHGFYEYLGFPRYLSLSAADRLMWRLSRSDEPRIASAWDVYQGMTYALSHDQRFEAGSSSDDDYHRVASDILSNPVKSLEDSQRGFRSRIQADEEEDRGPFQIDATTGEALQQYKEREDLIRASFGAGDVDE